MPCDAAGRCGVLLRNFGSDEYSVQNGDAVAQVSQQKPDDSACIRVDDVDDDLEVAVSTRIDDEGQLPLAASSKMPKGPTVNPHTSLPEFDVSQPKQGAKLTTHRT